MMGTPSLTVGLLPLWRRFRRNASMSIAGSGLILAIKLGQTVLLTRFLKIDDYGRVLIVLNLFVFLESFFGMRVNDVMFRFFPSLKEGEDRRALKGLLLFCLTICLVSGVVIYGGVALVSPCSRTSLSQPRTGALFNIYGCTVL